MSYGVPQVTNHPIDHLLPSSDVRNLGVVFDSDLSLKAHVS